MRELEFIQVRKDDLRHCGIFADMMIPYTRETVREPVSDEFVSRLAQSCINMQEPDRRLELAFIGGEPIGFLYGKVDREGHRGFIKPGYGYIMEFYVKPGHRRKGYGGAMLRRLERHFSARGAARMWLTTETASGELFWRSLGFVPTGEASPDNGMPVYEKEVTAL